MIQSYDLTLRGDPDFDAQHTRVHETAEMYLRT